MIGQEKVISQLLKYNIYNLPKSLLFIGQNGSGRRSLIKDLAYRLNLPIIDMIKEMSNRTSGWSEYLKEELSKAKLSNLYKIYLINLSDEHVNREIQTALLKLLEDTPEHMFIMLIAESDSDIVPPILNRCTQIRLEEYTKEQLKQIKMFSNDLVYKFYNTPGKLLNTDEKTLISLYNDCVDLQTSLPKMKLNDIIVLANKINYKEEYDKYNFNLFFEVLKQVSFDSYFKNNNSVSYLIYVFTVQFLDKTVDKINKTGQKNIMKENFMYNYLVNLWEVCRNDCSRA